MKKKLLLGIMMFTMAGQMIVPSLQAAPAGSNTVQAASTASSNQNKGEIVQSVNLRTKPSTSSSIIRLVKKGESVTILDKPNSSWYKVKDTKGNTGYVSSQSKYIRVGTSSGSNNSGNSNDNSNSTTSSSSKSAKMDKVESVAKKYMGTPYEYGSDRNTTKTFDCSDFVRHVYKEALGIVLPTDSRKQGAYIQDKGGVKKSISQLERGDLIFFMTYKGSSASSYKNVDKSKERITHVGIYLGNGKIIHTYSKTSGGVRIDDIRNTSWEHRFLFGGSVVK